MYKYIYIYIYICIYDIYMYVFIHIVSKLGKQYTFFFVTDKHELWACKVSAN